MPEYLTVAETAALTGLKPTHLAQLRYRRQGPPFLKPTPKTVRYRRADVLAWLDSSAVAPAAPGASRPGASRERQPAREHRAG